MCPMFQTMQDMLWRIYSSLFSRNTQTMGAPLKTQQLNYAYVHIAVH